MSASIMAYWPTMTEAQEEAQPGFDNDCQDWASWMAEGLSDPEVIADLERAGVLALATMTTEGMSDEAVFWVSPADLRGAAARLCHLIDEGDPIAAAIMESYEVTANYGEDLAEHFKRDLRDVEALAVFAEAQGAQKMTLSVSY
jgi:hypothetical protein